MAVDLDERVPYAYAVLCWARLWSGQGEAGNTGAASIFIMLDEALNSGRFKPGEKILLMVPESGRFSVSFALLTCVGPDARPPVARTGAEIAEAAARRTLRVVRSTRLASCAPHSPRCTQPTTSDVEFFIGLLGS